MNWQSLRFTVLNELESILGPFRHVVQTARPTQDTRDYYGLSAQQFSFKKCHAQSESDFSMLYEAENDQSLTTSSQPSLIGQAAKLRIDGTRARAYDQQRSILAATAPSLTRLAWTSFRLWSITTKKLQRTSLSLRTRRIKTTTCRTEDISPPLQTEESDDPHDLVQLPGHCLSKRR